MRNRIILSKTESICYSTQREEHPHFNVICPEIPEIASAIDSEYIADPTSGEQSSWGRQHTARAFKNR